MKIGQIGQRIDFFWSTITNEADLLQRFGIQVLPIDLVDFAAPCGNGPKPIATLTGRSWRVQEVDQLQSLPKRRRYSAQLRVPRRDARRRARE